MDEKRIFNEWVGGVAKERTSATSVCVVCGDGDTIGENKLGAIDSNLIPLCFLSQAPSDTLPRTLWILAILGGGFPVGRPGRHAKSSLPVVLGTSAGTKAPEGERARQAAWVSLRLEVNIRTSGGLQRPVIAGKRPGMTFPRVLSPGPLATGSRKARQAAWVAGWQPDMVGQASRGIRGVFGMLMPCLDSAPVALVSPMAIVGAAKTRSAKGRCS